MKPEIRQVPTFETEDQLIQWWIQQGYSEEEAIKLAKSKWRISGYLETSTGFVMDIELPDLNKD